MNTILSNFGGMIACDGGWIFTNEGTVWTADTSSLVGSVASGGIPLPDAANERAYFVAGTGTDPEPWIVSFDTATFRPMRAVRLEQVAKVGVREAVRMGTAGIAVGTDDELLLVPFEVLGEWLGPQVAVDEPARDVSRIELSVLALAASADGMLLATTPSWLGEWGNALLKIDPVRGSVEGSTFAGSEPTRLVVSGDGRFAYTYLAGEVRVCRINLASGVRDLRFAADPDGGERQHFVWDLASPPG